MNVTIDAENGIYFMQHRFATNVKIALLIVAISIPHPHRSLSLPFSLLAHSISHEHKMRVCELMSSLKNFYYDIYCGYVPELLPSLCNIQHSLFTIQRRGVVNSERALFGLLNEKSAELVNVRVCSSVVSVPFFEIE